MKVNLSIRWFDLWVGAYWDRAKRVLYICPLPCVCIALSFHHRSRRAA